MVETPEPPRAESESEGAHRRGFLERFSTWFMGLGLLGGYGTLAAMAGRYLYPARPAARGWLFTTQVDRLEPGASMTYTTPAGDSVIITRRGEGAADGDFIALSSTCPHLGCRVHWEGQNDRFFCPCHNGAFDRQGTATEGPPAAAKKDLPRYNLKVENGLLFIDVPLERVPIGAGHERV